MRLASTHLSERAMSALLDGELGFLQVREARLHLERCGPCRGNVEEMTEIDCRIALARNRGRPRPGLLGGLLGAIRAAQGGDSPTRVTRRRFGVPGLAAAAAVILIGLAWFALPPGNVGGRDEPRLALSPAPGLTHWPARHSPMESPGVPLLLAAPFPASPSKTSPRPAGPAREPSLTDLATPVAAPPPREERPSPVAPSSLEFVVKVLPAPEASPAPLESLLARAEPSHGGEPPPGTEPSPTVGPPRGAQPLTGAGPVPAGFVLAALNPEDPEYVYEEEEGRPARDFRVPFRFEKEEIGSWRDQELGWQEPSEERPSQVAAFAISVSVWS